MRQQLVKDHFPQLKENLRAASLFDIWAGPIAAMAHWIALVSSSLGRTITWRDITYRLYRGGRVETVMQNATIELRAFREEMEKKKRDDSAVEKPVVETETGRQKAA